MCFHKLEKGWPAKGICGTDYSKSPSLSVRVNKSPGVPNGVGFGHISDGKTPFYSICVERRPFGCT